MFVERRSPYHFDASTAEELFVQNIGYLRNIIVKNSEKVTITGMFPLKLKRNPR